MPKKLSKNKINEIIKIMLETYPDARAELNHNNAFELLIATILSAQCTDIRVNKVTPKLFSYLDKPAKIYNIDDKTLENTIKSCGLYKIKAKNIRKTCEILEQDYGSDIPKDISELTKLPGVGRKTANVVVSNAFGIPAIAVDTHVKRLSNRIGLAESEDVYVIEKQLMQNIPKKHWTKMHHALIFHGRRICKAKKPNCENCKINGFCLRLGL